MAEPQIYILSSDEPLLKNDLSKNILDKAHQLLPEAPLLLFTQSDFASSGKANLRALETELLDPGLFGGDRIIKIYLSDLNNIAIEVLYLLATRMRSGIVVIVDLPRILSSLNKVKAEKFDLNQKKAKTLTAEKVFAYLKYVQAEITIAYPPEGRQLYQWVNQRAYKYNLSLMPESCEYFSKACEGNLTLIDQTLQILALNPKTSSVGLDEAVAILDADSRFQNLELAEAVLNGDGARALLVLNSTIQAINNPESLLLSQLQALDRLFTAVAALKREPRSMSSYMDKVKFFAPFSIKSPKTMDAVIKAAYNMPEHLFNYLIDKFAHASALLCEHEVQRAILVISEGCACVSNFNVKNLKAL